MASRPIDEKIVVMRLDNSDFKQKAMETTGLFGILKDSLNKIPGVNLGKTVQELNGIQTAAGGTNLNGLSTAVQGISTKFSAMSVIATTALATIVNKAVNAGTSLAKSLSLDQITAGFSEYELKMGSIQTILANTSKHGTDLGDVSKSLNELNEYADQTIYNFGDMTKNIGLFTNAGLKLEESVSMIKGFSNAAAASGTSADGAAHAAYQLSQGLSAGYIMTQDWMSLTNAGMGNDNMKNDLIALGQEMGTLDRTSDDTLKNWKESLSDDKWLTTDVMSKYLQTMAGEVSKAELMTMGLSDEQATLMLNNAKIAEEAATKVRTFTGLLGGLKEGIGSGWATTFENIFGDFDEATTLWSGISDKLGASVVKSSEARNAFVKGVADGGGFLNIFAGVENLAKPVIQIFGAISTAFKRVFPPASVATVIKLTESFKNFTAGLLINKDRMAQLTTIFQGVFSVFSTVWEIAKRLTLAFIQLIPEGTGGGALDLIEKIAKLAIGFNKSVKEGNGLTKFIESFGKALGAVGKFLGDFGSGVMNVGRWIKDNLGTAIDWVVDKLKPVGAYFKEAFGGSYGDEAVGAGVLVAIFAIVKKIKDFFDGDDFDIFGSLSDMVDGVKDTFEGIGEAVNNFATSIKYVNLILIAVAIGILAVSLKLMEGISAADLAKGITALATALGVMILGMMVMSKFSPSGGLRSAATLIALAAAVTIMAIALKLISDLDKDELIRGITGLAAIVAVLSIAIIAISKFGGKISVGSLQLLALAAAVVILASAVETMSEIKPGDLFKAIGALALIFLSLAVFLKIVDRTKFGIGSALGVLAIAAAVKILVSAIEDIAELNVNQLVKGLGTITLILLAVALFSKVAGGPQMLLAGAGMLLMAAGINAMVGPITAFSEMSWEELAKGMAAMAVSLLILAGASYLMTGGILGAVGVLAMALALNMLVEPIERFAAMTWGDMLKGFAGAAIGMGLMAVAAILLTPAILPMLGFGAAILIMGLAILAAGVGMALFGTGLATLATLTAGSIAAIVSALALLIQGLYALIDDVISFVVKLSVALLDGLLLLVPKIVEVVLQIITALLTSFANHLPSIIKAGGDIIVGFIDGMAIEIPRIIESVANLMTQLATAVETNSGVFLNAWLSIMTEVAVVMVRSGAAVIDALFGWIPGVGEVTSKIGETAELNIRDAFDAQKVAENKGDEFTTSLSGKSGDAKTAGTKLGTQATLGAATADLSPVGMRHGLLFSTGLRNTSGTSKSAGTTLSTSATTGVNGINLNPIGTGAGTEFANGLASKTGASKSSGTSLATSGKSGASSVSLNSSGTNFGTGFASGMSGAHDAVVRAAKSLASKAKSAVTSWLGIKSPSRLMMKDGGFFGEGFAIGISDSAKLVGENAKSLAVTAKDSLNQFIDSFELPESDSELHFKAVVDYDALDPKGFGTLSPIQPDTSFANRMVSASKNSQRVSSVNEPVVVSKESSNTEVVNVKTPAVIQIVTPEKREMARWLVDDITEFQDFKMATKAQF